MRRQVYSVICLSMLAATTSAQPADPAPAPADDYGAAALAGLVDVILAQSEPAPRAERLAAFAAEPVDASWASRMMSRIYGRLGDSDLAFAELRSECRSTACVVEFTSTVAWTATDERERFSAEFSELWGALARDSGPEDVTASTGNMSYDVAQDCRITGRFVLQRYSDVPAPPSAAGGAIRVDLADAARCSL